MKSADNLRLEEAEGALAERSRIEMISSNWKMFLKWRSLFSKEKWGISDECRNNQYHIMKIGKDS